MDENDHRTKTFYEDGKARRYALLFSVNGGAFAVLSLAEKAGREPSPSARLIGDLSVWQLSVGLAAFSAVMVYDIFAFGEKMRARDGTLFGPAGQLVLLAIGALLVLGWLLSAGLFAPHAATP